jgi:3-deoxy-D-manno-octulosonic acid kinase
VVAINQIDKNNFLLSSDDHAIDINAQWFDVDYWQDNQAIIGSSTGRNTTYFFQHDDAEYVLRHYYRGGLIGKFNRDKYLYRSIEQTRVYQELALLASLRSLNLPAPEPVAGRVKVEGLFYRADLITGKIPQATDTFHKLLSSRLSEQQWHSIGATIKRFHQHNVYHADLNIHNIMQTDSGDIWLIDFDRGQIKHSNDQTWKQQNLDRLLRSLNKEQKKYPEFQWQQQEWQYLLNGYQSA